MRWLMRRIVPDGALRFVLDHRWATVYVWATIIDDSPQFLRFES